MKVLIFISSLSSGGAERVTATLANYWAEKGWHVTVVTLAAKSEDFYQLHPEVIRIELDLVGGSRHWLEGLTNNLRRLLALRQVLRQVQPDVALGMMGTLNVKLALAAFGLRGMVTIGSERIHPPQLPLGAIWSTLRRFSYGRLDGIVALTAESASWLRRHTWAHKVAVIPNVASYPLTAQAPRVAPPVKAVEMRMLLAVGRLSHQKGFDVLITTFQELAAQFPNWYLAVLGEGPLRDELSDQAKGADLGGRILLPGRVGNVGDWYAAADLYVMTSRFEGFPNSLAEAMAYGLPAVSFDCNTGPRDIIRHEIDGVLVPQCDVAALSAALTRLMGDEDLRKQYGTRAIEVREKFSMERIAGMWELFFQELICKKG